jgi:hypothetical protein
MRQGFLDMPEQPGVCAKHGSIGPTPWNDPECNRVQRDVADGLVRFVRQGVLTTTNMAFVPLYLNL